MHFRIALLILTVLSAFGMSAQGQDAPAKDLKIGAAKGLAPRATPADYQAQVKAGAVTIAAEFLGHAIPLPQETLSTEDYVVVEVGMFGDPDARLMLSVSDFSLRINDKKTPAPNQPYELVFKTLKSPEYEPPSKSEAGKTSFGTGGGQTDPNAPPPPVHIPIEVRRTWQQHIQEAAMLEGERPLPQAGLLYFLYRGKTQSIHSLELIYSGAAGKAAVALRP
jgi:hypothetical protein